MEEEKVWDQDKPKFEDQGSTELFTKGPQKIQSRGVVDWRPPYKKRPQTDSKYSFTASRNLNNNNQSMKTDEIKSKYPTVKVTPRHEVDHLNSMLQLTTKPCLSSTNGSTFVYNEEYKAHVQSLDKAHFFGRDAYTEYNEARARASNQMKGAAAKITAIKK